MCEEVVLRHRGHDAAPVLVAGTVEVLGIVRMWCEIMLHHVIRSALYGR